MRWCVAGEFLPFWRWRRPVVTFLLLRTIGRHLARSIRLACAAASLLLLSHCAGSSSTSSWGPSGAGGSSGSSAQRRLVERSLLRQRHGGRRQPGWRQPRRRKPVEFVLAGRQQRPGYGRIQQRRRERRRIVRRVVVGDRKRARKLRNANGHARSNLPHAHGRRHVAHLLRVPALVGCRDEAAPFLFVMHGATQNGNDMITITGYESVADSEGIAVAFLDGENTNSMTSASTLDPWNVSDNGAAVCGAGDLANSATAKVDFDFLDAVKADVAQDQCLDTAHIFATGFSMGGYFTHHIGCDRTDIRAMAPRPAARSQACRPAPPDTCQSSSSTAPRTRSSPRAVTTPTVLPSRASRRRPRSGRRRTAARRPTRRLPRTAPEATTASATSTTAAPATDRSSSAHSRTWSTPGPAPRAVRAALARETATQAPRSWSGRSSEVRVVIGSRIGGAGRRARVSLSAHGM